MSDIGSEDMEDQGPNLGVLLTNPLFCVLMCIIYRFMKGSAMRQERGMGRERQFYPMGISMMEATRMGSDMEGYVMLALVPKSCIYTCHVCMHTCRQPHPSTLVGFLLYYICLWVISSGSYS